MVVFDIFKALIGENMSRIINCESITFVTYKVDPIPGVYKDSLGQHLLNTVCGDRSRVDEMIDVFEGDGWIHEVRYQFGECFSHELAEEVGALIEQEIIRWNATKWRV